MFEDAPEESTFPLLGLPNDAIKKVINQMTIFQIFTFSLISNRTCQLVSEIHPKICSASVIIKNTIELRIDMFTHFTFRPSHQEIDQSPEQKIKMTGPVDTWARFEYYSKEGFTIKDWVRHIFKTFNCSCGTINWQNTTGKYSGASVKRVFPTCDRLMIDISNPQFEAVTDKILAKSIKIGRNVLEELHLTERLQKIQIQNFSRVFFSNRASFDTILMSNAKCFDVCSSSFTYKEANRFLKLWARGAMPNLQHFSSAVRLDTRSVDLELVTERIFKGIEYNWSNEQIQCGECQSVRHHGFAIYRVGGARALVDIYSEDEDSEEYFLFDVFVEH